MSRTAVFAVIVSILLTSMPPVARADTAGLVKIDDSVEVLEQMMKIPEKGIPPALLNNAGGIAIIPGVIKAGFILGGRYGRGILVMRGKNGSWSNPVFISITGGSIGWQIGVESIDIVLVFKSNRSIKGILRGRFTLGADASIAAGPVGRQASAATDIQLRSEIYSYSRSRGLFAGLALEGAAIQINYDADEAFYGKDHALPADIIGNTDLKVPPVVGRLKELLAEYSSEGAASPKSGGETVEPVRPKANEKSGIQNAPQTEKNEKDEETERSIKMGEPGE